MDPNFEETSFEPTTQIFKISARQAVYLIGLAQFLASLLSMVAIDRFSRRTLLLFGHASSCVLLCLLALATYYKSNDAFLALIIFYSFTFNFSNATVINVYIVETCCDVALGTCLVAMQIVILIETVTVFPIIDSFGPSLFFLLYSVLSCMGLLFVFFFIGETKELSESEKLTLYVPGMPYGRKLKQNEVFDKCFNNQTEYVK